jgi:asparagine synthetase B (glutamine-hydrolysing)
MQENFNEETVRKLSKLHMYDCLRANKSLAALGIEGRLDKEFMDVAMRVNPQDNNKNTQWKNGLFVKHLRTCCQKVLLGDKRAV